MNAERLWGSMAVAVACCALGGWLGAGEPAFELTMSAPPSLVGEADSAIQYTAMARLTTTGLAEGEAGAQGWSLSVSAEGGEIVGAETAGTIVETLYDEGFQDTQLTTGGEGACDGKKGAVSAVVLSLQKSVTLPPAGTVDVLKLTVAATVPQPGTTPAGDPVCIPATSRVYFVDGCQGRGQPVDNKITYGGQSYRPALGEANTSICPEVKAPLVIRAEVVEPPATPGATEGNVVEQIVAVSPGAAEVAVTAGVFLVANLEGAEKGPQGWSISVKTDACFGIQSATIEGTQVPDYYSGGFQKTEVVDPAKPENAGQEGAVSAIVLSLTEERYLPPVSSTLVLRIGGAMDSSAIAAAGDRVLPPCVVIASEPSEPGLKGSGQPVKTAVTVEGVTRTPGVIGAGIILEGAAEARFIRGNPNDDSKVDLADPIWIANELFRQGPPTECQDAADANDDGMVDSSDVVFLLAYLFGYNPGGGSLVAGAQPPAPFPGCGTDPTEDELVCPAGSAKSCR